MDHLDVTGKYAEEVTSPLDQSSYQVRFEWGAAGLARLAPADITIVVDVLRFSSTLVAMDEPVKLADALAWSINGAAVAQAASRLDPQPLVLIGCLRNASAVADIVLRVQDERQQRTSVTVIAAGERDAEGDLRIAVEDQLGAGAVIAALIDLGIDHTSPEAVAASETFRGLRQAVRHLLSASGSGRELAVLEADSTPRAATVREAAAIDDSTVVPVLRDGAFVPFA